MCPLPIQPMRNSSIMYLITQDFDWPDSLLSCQDTRALKRTVTFPGLYYLYYILCRKSESFMSHTKIRDVALSFQILMKLSKFSL